jgi:hypothetical protein
VYAHLAEVFGVSRDAILPPSHNLDIIMAHVCHRTPLRGLRGCLDPWAASDLYDALEENGMRAVKEDDYLRGVKLKMHPLLHEIAERMIKQSSKQSQLKFVLYSGHDTTIEPLAAALGFSSGTWARYASRIVFELYQNTKSSGKFSIRVLYNGYVVTPLLPFCRGDERVQKSGLCQLREFANFVRMGSMRDLGAGDYAEACAVPISSDPF